MSTAMLNEWTGYGLANGEHLDYAKAVVGALCDLDHDKVPIGEPLAALDTLNTKYTDFVNESRKFVDTADIAKAVPTGSDLIATVDCHSSGSL